MPISAELFRDLLSRFPSGVTIVTTTDARGRPQGMTVSAFCSLSLEPPLVLACIERTASMYEVLAAGRAFGVNLLADDQAPLSARFSQAEADVRFEGVPYSAGMHGVPLLHGVHATLECRVVARHDGGDHGIVVATVEHGSIGSPPPLIYHRGTYRRFEDA